MQIKDLEAKKEYKLEKTPYSFTIHPSKDMIAFSCFYRRLIITKKSNQEIIKVFEDDEDHITYIKFTPCGDHLITCSEDESIKIYETGEF